MIVFIDVQNEQIDRALVELQKPKHSINIYEVDEVAKMTLLHLACAQGAMVRLKFNSPHLKPVMLIISLPFYSGTGGGTIVTRCRSFGCICRRQ